MEQKRPRLDPSAPPKNVDLQKRSQNNLNHVKSFFNSFNNFKEMTTYFFEKNHKPKKNYKKYEVLTTILKSFDTFVIIAATSSSNALSPIGISLIVIPISTGVACGLTISKEIIYELILNKNEKYKRQHEKDQKAFESFDKLNRKSLQDNLIDKIDYESLYNIFTGCLDEIKKKCFLKTYI